MSTGHIYGFGWHGVTSAARVALPMDWGRGMIRTHTQINSFTCLNSSSTVAALAVDSSSRSFMNPISNAWKHPKTSAAGLLIAIATISGVLSQQGINLGHAGSGTVVTLAGAVASALLGLLARDPGQSALPKSPAIPSSARLGAWALIALLIPMPMIAGCSGISVAQEIVNWAPALQSAVSTVDSAAALLAPADGPIFVAATVGFDAASNLLVNQARAYLSNPSAGALAQIQAQIVIFQQQVNSALLEAARIVNPASQKHALAAVQSVATVVGALFALVQSIRAKPHWQRWRRNHRLNSPRPNRTGTALMPHG